MLPAGCMDPGSIHTCSLGMHPWPSSYRSMAFVQYWGAVDSNPYTAVVAAVAGTASMADTNYPRRSSDWLSCLRWNFEQSLLLPTLMASCLIQVCVRIQLCPLFQRGHLVEACSFHRPTQTHHADSCVASSFSPSCLSSCVYRFH